MMCTKQKYLHFCRTRAAPASPTVVKVQDRHLGLSEQLCGGCQVLVEALVGTMAGIQMDIKVACKLTIIVVAIHSRGLPEQVRKCRG